jgi:ABC-type lipoprotein release transport system permease subunit
MLKIASGLIAAWPLVGKRSLAHWRLLSSVVIGVFLASAVMAGTVIYFESLRELALESTLRKLTTDETNILVKASRGPTNSTEYDKVAAAMNLEFDRRVDWLLDDRIRGGKTVTFFVTRPGEETRAGDDNARGYFAFLPRLMDHVTVLPGGRQPAEQALGRQPFELEALVPEEAAELFGIGVGDRLSAIPFWDDAIPYASVVVSGIFRKDEPAHQIWHMERGVFQAATGATFRTAPFYLSERTFMDVLGGAFRNMDSVYSWLLVVDAGALEADNSTEARTDVVFMGQELSARLHSYLQITSLDSALAEYDRRLFFSKVPMFVVLVLISVVILYYVVTLSSLLAEERRGDIALLRSRGASAAQVLAVFALEGATIAVLAIVVAPLGAAVVIGLLGYTPAFSDLSDTGRLPVVLTGGAFMMSAIGGVLSFAALMVPAAHALRTGVTQHRQQAARPSTQPLYQRYYLDVALLAVAVLLFRQLEEQGSVVATDLFGRLAVDQLLLAVPALVLVAFAVVLLRLFPLAIRFLSGDSPGLVHMVMASTLLILLPSIIVRETVNGGGSSWLAQVAFLAALGAVYWATDRENRAYLRAGGMALQAGLIAAALFVGPTLPLEKVSVPILVAVVPAQVLFLFLRAVGQRMPVGIAMGLWQMARNPTHYARLSLLLILMAGLGIVAASFGGTLSRNFEERALYKTGAPIRLDGVVLNSSGQTRALVDEYEELAGVDEAAPAFRGQGSDLSNLFGESYTMFAVDTGPFAEIAWFRQDFSDRPMAELLASLEPDRAPEGILLPGDARSIGILVKADRPHPSVAARARLRDSNGRYFSVCLGTLDSTEWRTLSANLVRLPNCRGRPSRLRPVPPLTLVSVAFDELDWRSKLRAGSASIDEIHVNTATGDVLVIEEFNDTSRWNVLRAAAESDSDLLQPTSISFQGNSNAATFVWTDGRPLTSRGIFHGSPTSPLPVLSSDRFAEETGHAVGEEFMVSVSGHRVPVKLVDTVSFFPTLDIYHKLFLISDLSALARYANLEATSGEIKPNEMWLSVDGNGFDRTALVERLEGNEPFANTAVRDRERVLADSQVDPLVEAGWNALLFIAFATVFILSGLGFLVHAYVSFRSRQVQFALMRTVGFSMNQLMTLVWLEQALVIVAGMALGTWMGGRLGEVIMPFLAHDDQGSQVLPPFTMEVDWVTLGVTYAAMALLFAIITMGVIWFIRRISLQRILRLGEM